VKIVFLGDLHIGNAATDEDLIKQVAKRLQEPNTYWVDLGDTCDFVNMRDPRFSPAALPEWVEVSDLADLPAAQVRRYAEIFKPVAGTCLARLMGNHEAVIAKHYERNVYHELNASIGLPKEKALGYGGFLRLVTQRKKDSWTLTCFIHHGATGGKLGGAVALNLERLPMSFDADIYAVGHSHRKMVFPKRRVGILGRTLQVADKPLILINVGAFMRSYTQTEGDGYAEQRLLYPQGLGPVELWIWPDAQKRQIKVVQ